ncbi:phosphodiester glycosidase family protein [Paenibacillus sp. Mc5Re-14]|uniref:phosphodiester glycosidase family protein n=1 Tax=Paenibacillus sp. Mc5Re-14 TaxID=1030529 RepID=UPI000A874F4B|nr:phosphodiester glycosidase family protein [Paenibacillus sp. Mc5Re-14]
MPANYSYTKTSDGFHVIITPASNIQNKNIRSRITQQTDYGINGGFFYPISTTKPPTQGLSIAVTPNNTHDIKANAKENSRGTAFIFTESNKTKIGITRTSSVTDLKKQMGTTIKYKSIISGGSLSLKNEEEVWLKELKEIENFDLNGTLRYTESIGRTGLGFKVVNNIWQVYLVVHENATLKQLRNYFIKQDCFEAILLDGGGSSGIQVKNSAGTMVKYEQTRYIYNMVKLINIT